eukprot:gene18067-21585_t
MSHEILQTGLQLAKSAVEADQLKNYLLASTLYEQAILNLKLALISERDPAKNALVSSKIEEYVQRSKFIKNLAAQQPSQVPSQPTTSSAAFSFPSVPSSVSPAVANMPVNNNYQTSSKPFPDFPSAQPQQQQQQQPNASFTKLSSLPSASDQFTQKANNHGRVESAKGRKEEEVRDYRKATQYYEQACTYYLAAMKNEPDSMIKKNISDEAKVYLDRVETLKPYVLQQPQPSPVQPSPPQQPTFQQPTFQQPTFQQPSFQQPGGGGQMNSSLSMLNSFPSASSISSSTSSAGGIRSSGMLITSPTSSIPHTFTGGDKCAACGANLSTNSIKALDRSWHPECFSVTIICAGCHKPFSLVNLSLKVKDNCAYHPLCFESTTGLYQEERRTFVGTSKTLFFSIQLQRKFYKAGETLQFAFIIDNPTKQKVGKVIAYLLMTESRMEIVGTAYERRTRRTTAKLGRCEFFHSSRFPLVKDRFEGDFFFSLPPNLLPSEVAGVDAAFVREYQLVVKCVGPPLKTMTVKLRFNLNILESPKQQ